MHLSKIFGLLLMTTLFFSCSNAQESESNEQGESEKVAMRVDKGTFKAMMAKHGENAQLLDVRTAGEVANGKIGDAIEINFHDADFKEQLKALDTSRPILLYCAAGGRSARTMKVMEEMGFEKIYELEGGYNVWKN